MKKKQVYLVGIKGVAMTALAVYLKEAGYLVSGSDTDEVFPTDAVLKKNAIPVKKGFSEKNINGGIDLLISTGAHGGRTNIEVQTAMKRHIETYMHGQYLGELMSGKFGISVCGCHGKTTTSAVIASILSHSKYDPSYLIGAALINDLGSSGHYGKGKYLVVEADEYMTCPITDKTPRFLWQKPQILVMTNIEFDHPDAYRDIQEVKNAYLKFTENLPDDGIIIACIDSENIRAILPEIKKPVITYGFSPKADYCLEKVYFGDEVSFMRIRNREVGIGEFMVRIPGKHNVLNALAASIAANQIGISWTSIKKHLKNYTGCKRRFERIACRKNILLYDDYAHHPSEISATVTSAKEWFPGKRLIVIFQPHTFSRTKTLLTQFGKSFTKADILLVPDIYPSAREGFDSSISSRHLVEEVNKNKKNAVYMGNKPDLLDYIRKNVKENDLIFTMGAGDIYLWHKELLAAIDTIQR